MGAVESVDQEKKKDAIQTRACICYPRRRCSHVAFKSWPGSVSHRYTTLVRSHTRCRTVSHWDGGGGEGGQEKKGRRIGGHYFLLLLLAFPEGTLEV